MKGGLEEAVVLCKILETELKNTTVINGNAEIIIKSNTLINENTDFIEEMKRERERERESETERERERGDNKEKCWEEKHQLKLKRNRCVSSRFVDTSIQNMTGVLERYYLHDGSFWTALTVTTTTTTPHTLEYGR